MAAAFTWSLSSGLDIFGGVRIQPFGRQLGTFSIDMATVYGRGIDYFWLSVETWADYKTDCILIYNFLCFRCDFAFGFAIFVFCHDFHPGQKCLTSRRRLIFYFGLRRFINIYPFLDVFGYFWDFHCFGAHFGSVFSRRPKKNRRIAESWRAEDREKSKPLSSHSFFFFFSPYLILDTLLCAEKPESYLPKCSWSNIALFFGRTKVTFSANF